MLIGCFVGLYGAIAVIISLLVAYRARVGRSVWSLFVFSRVIDTGRVSEGGMKEVSYVRILRLYLLRLCVQHVHVFEAIVILGVKLPSPRVSVDDVDLWICR